MEFLEEVEYYSISYLLAKIIKLFFSMSGTKLELCIHYLN